MNPFSLLVEDLPDIMQDQLSQAAIVISTMRPLLLDTSKIAQEPISKA
jgi:hypothetical protein